MKRRLIAAAIFVGILLLLLWFSQPSAHALNQHKGHSHTRQSSRPRVTLARKEARGSAPSADSESIGEVEWDPTTVWGPPPALAYAPIGLLLGMLSFPAYLMRLKQNLPKPIHLLR